MDIGKILGKVAPFITAALPGPLSGMANGVLKGVFGIGEDDEDGDSKLESAVQKISPEQTAELIKAENDFKLRMEELGHKSVADLRKLEIDDLANARQREVDLARAGARDSTGKILAFGACAAWIGMMVYVLMADIDQWGQVKVSIVSGVIGTLSGILLTIFAYYFGTSKGSTEKNAMLEKLAAKASG